MREIYHQKVPFIVAVILISSSIACYKFYISYLDSNSLLHFFLATFSLLLTILFIKPIIAWRRVEIDDDYIVIFMTFYKPKKFNISKSLYQVTTHNQDIFSFRFRSGEYYTQVTPMIYRNGKDLSRRLTDHIKKHNLHVDIR